MAEKKRTKNCAACAALPETGRRCDDCLAQAKGFYSIKLITDTARGIAARVENGSTLDQEHQVFVKNVLRDYADRLDRKSMGKSGKGVKKNSQSNDEARLRATSNRIQNEFNRLMEIRTPKKARGRQPGGSVRKLNKKEKEI